MDADTTTFKCTKYRNTDKNRCRLFANHYSKAVQTSLAFVDCPDVIEADHKL